MKKTLLITAAALAVGSGAMLALTETSKLQSAPAKTEAIAKAADDLQTIETTVAVSSGYNTNEYPITLTSYNETSASQCLYPAALLNEKIGLDEYTVTEIIYTVEGTSYTGKVTSTIMMAATDQTTLPSAFTEDQLTLVGSNVEIDFSTVTNGKLRIPLTTPFLLKKGQSLVIAFFTRINDATRPNPLPKFMNSEAAGGGTHTRFYNTFFDAPNISDLYFDTNLVAALDLVYVDGEYTAPGPKDVVDLSVTSLSGPEGQLYTDKNYEFTASITNLGNVDAENYKVELYDVESNNVLASSVIEKALVGGLSTSVTFNYTFATAGTFKLAARVIYDGDENADNNACEPITVNVDELAYKAVAVNGTATPAVGAPETYTVSVRNEGSTLLENYTVSLLLVRNGLSDLVIGTSDSNPTIQPNESADISFNYTFELSGEYNLKGIVTKGEGEPSETPLFKVNIPLDKLSPVITNTFPECKNDTYTFDGSFINYGNNAQISGANQIIYPSDFFGEHNNNYQIQSLTFKLKWDYAIFGLPAIPVKIWLAQTDRNSQFQSGSVSLVPQEDFVLVYDGPFNIEKTTALQDVTLELQNLFTLENGKSLVINISSWDLDDQRGMGPDFCATEYTYSESYGVYARKAAYDPDFTVYSSDATLRIEKRVPCLTLGYALEPLPAKMDMAVTGFEITSNLPDAPSPDPVSFRVSFENKGTVDIEEYTIQLLNIEQNGDETLLGSYEGTRYIAPGSKANQTISYTFNSNGNYNLAARVVVDGDIDEKNNISSPAIPLAVDWVKTDSVADILAEGTLSYDATSKTLLVNVGEGEVIVSDLAGRKVASYALDGAAQFKLDLPAGVYVINANGKILKIRI